jgi:ATP-dependent Clp protease ATP-binding subunit ClpC
MGYKTILNFVYLLTKSGSFSVDKFVSAPYFFLNIFCQLADNSSDRNSFCLKTAELLNLQDQTLLFMDDNFSPRVKDVITYSKEEALRLGHDFIGTEHLMLGILRDGNGKAISILNNLSVDLDHLRRKVEILSPANPNVVATNEKKNLHLTRQAERALKTTFLEAKVFQSSSISTAHLL